MKRTSLFLQNFTNWLAGKQFFYLIVGLLIIQAIWIALSGRYPMAFDEDFHIGIIRLYAHHLSPVWSGQPVGADAFGAVARDPSYLFHYLMSFPYRLITALTGNLMAQILLLRAINVSLFATGLVLWRRLLLKTGASVSLVQACLLLFILIPVVPMLAAQINYDNLLMPLVAGILLLVLRLQSAIKQEQTIPFQLLSLVIGLCLLTSLVKYAFLPILAAIGLFLVVCAYRNLGGFRRLLSAIHQGFVLASRRAQILGVILLIVASGLFVERYGVNLVRYHTPIPDCGQVLTVKQCSAYGPWIRDYNFAINKVSGDSGPVGYVDDWFYGMWLRLFFAVDGPASDFQTRGPLLIPAVSAIIVAAFGVLAVLLDYRQSWRRLQQPIWLLFGSIFAIYVSVLWLQDYKMFVHTGQPVAINGRYLLPVILPLIIFFALAIQSVLRQQRMLKMALLLSVFICMIWGGGLLTYILRSNDNWYWPDHSLKTANHAVQRTIGPLTPGYTKPTLFLR